MHGETVKPSVNSPARPRKQPTGDISSKVVRKFINSNLDLFKVPECAKVRRCSAVGIAARYALDGPAIESR